MHDIIKLRLYLRNQTEDLHADLDQSMTKEVLTTQDGYRDFLRMHAVTTPPLEAALANVPQFFAGLPDLDGRWRSAALAEDCEVLEINTSNKYRTDVSNLNSQAQAAGILYVLEGSRLGSRLISGWLAEGSVGRFPRSFLDHGKDSNHWGSFLTWLDSIHWSQTQRQDMVSAARETFAHYLISRRKIG